MKIYLDLLPQEKKNEIKRRKIFRIILREEFLFSLPIIIFIVILFNVYYLLNIQYSSALAASSINKAQEKYRELSSYEEKFIKVNESVDALTKIQGSQLHWINVLRELSLVTPDGIALSDLSTKNYQIFLLGKADSRDDLLEFKSKLDVSACFQSVNVPLSNLVVKEDVDFQLDFTVAQDCLKVK